MENKPRIPVIDIQAYAIDVKKECVGQKRVKALASQVSQAFSTVGFIYVKNHGIPKEKVEDVLHNGKNFFTLNENSKRKYERGLLTENHGWLRIGGEKFDDRPADYKECYDVNPPQAKVWPSEELPHFQRITEEFYDCCRKLASNLMQLLAIGLNLEDKNYFNSRHNPDQFTFTALRYLYYPPMPAHEGKRYVKEFPTNQLRCGEHTDYGTMTLLFQDDAGGLEVYDRDLGEYVPAPPIPGTVVVNLGDLMQRWTADLLLSTKHRVLKPVSQESQVKARQSVVCFVHPDADCLVECIDGSNKYPPITARDFIAQRFANTLVDSKTSVEKTNGQENGHVKGQRT